jgi:glyoxylase-like metal-dependent hydrolase (beta-lactamase superfamily II)
VFLQLLKFYLLYKKFKMDIHTLDTGFFKLDGGAMFGVVPKTIWQKSVPADADNLCTWAMRCLLVQDGNRLILIDNGIGQKQEQSFLKHYHLSGEATLSSSLKKLGFTETDITDVILTHLHFDHCGGSVQKNDDKLSLTFPNARYWSNSGHWDWAVNPNPREKSSFLKENILPIQQSGHLNFIEPDQKSPFENIDFYFADGHTEKQMIPKIRKGNQTFVFCADLVPSMAHIPIPYVMGYDMRPLLTMQEKQNLLQEATENEYILIFEHDAQNESCTVEMTEKGIRMKESGFLQNFIK